MTSEDLCIAAAACMLCCLKSFVFFFYLIEQNVKDVHIHFCKECSKTSVHVILSSVIYLQGVKPYKYVKVQECILENDSFSHFWHWIIMECNVGLCVAPLSSHGLCPRIYFLQCLCLSSAVPGFPCPFVPMDSGLRSIPSGRSRPSVLILGPGECRWSSGFALVCAPPSGSL